MNKFPLVSIGMPVYNGEFYISKVIEAILAQTYTKFELIISDNASVDNTENICRNYSKQDNRIKYIKQIENQGALFNFKYVLEKARGEYFMWAAADDLRDVNFLFECVTILDTNPYCVAATSFDSMIGSNYVRKFEVKGNFHDRLVIFFNNCWNSHGLFYSLIRTHIVKGFDFRYLKGLGSDWTFIIYLISQGEIQRSSKSLTQFSSDGVSNSKKRYSLFRNSFINWIFPFLDFSLFVIKFFNFLNFNQKINVLNYLIKLNLNTCFNQFIFELKILKSFLLSKFIVKRNENKF
jgi:glycosyltransferase involved in cell wall biosynthesis